MEQLATGTRVKHKTAGHRGTLVDHDARVPEVYLVDWDHGQQGHVSPKYLVTSSPALRR